MRELAQRCHPRVVEWPKVATDVIRYVIRVIYAMRCVYSLVAQSV